MTRLWPAGEPVEIWGGNGRAEGFYWRSQPYRILDVCNRWRIHTLWWESNGALWREYWKVVTDAGLLCLICQDLASGSWSLCRVYD